MGCSLSLLLTGGSEKKSLPDLVARNRRARWSEVTKTDALTSLMTAFCPLFSLVKLAVLRWVTKKKKKRRKKKLCVVINCRLSTVFWRSQVLRGTKRKLLSAQYCLTWVIIAVFFLPLCARSYDWQSKERVAEKGSWTYQPCFSCVLASLEEWRGKYLCQSGTIDSGIFYSDSRRSYSRL